MAAQVERRPPVLGLHQGITITDAHGVWTLRSVHGLLKEKLDMFESILQTIKRSAHIALWMPRRRRQVRRYLSASTVKKLQLGTGPHRLTGWLNTDIAPQYWDTLYLDVTRRFPFQDENFDYVFAEHVIEHVSYKAAKAMLNECSRVLRPGGRIRIATPNLRALLLLCEANKDSATLSYLEFVSRFGSQIGVPPSGRWDNGVFAINLIFYGHEHKFIYDFGTLAGLLEESGFRHCVSYAPGESDDEALKNVEGHGEVLRNHEANQFESLVVQAVRA
jgi:SAM-dependent methyltransferase